MSLEENLSLCLGHNGPVAFMIGLVLLLAGLAFGDLPEVYSLARKNVDLTRSLDELRFCALATTRPNHMQRRSDYR